MKTVVSGDIRADLGAFISEHLAKDMDDVDVTKDSLIETGVIDSLGIMKLVEHLEGAFGIKITDDELLPENFEDLDTIAELVRGKTA